MFQMFIRFFQTLPTFFFNISKCNQCSKDYFNKRKYYQCSKDSASKTSDRFIRREPPQFRQRSSRAWPRCPRSRRHSSSSERVSRLRSDEEAKSIGNKTISVKVNKRTDSCLWNATAAM